MWCCQLLWIEFSFHKQHAKIQHLLHWEWARNQAVTSEAQESKNKSHFKWAGASHHCTHAPFPHGQLVGNQSKRIPNVCQRPTTQGPPHTPLPSPYSLLATLVELTHTRFMSHNTHPTNCGETAHLGNQCWWSHIHGATGECSAELWRGCSLT